MSVNLQIDHLISKFSNISTLKCIVIIPVRSVTSALAAVASPWAVACPADHNKALCCCWAVAGLLNAPTSKQRSFNIFRQD